MLRNPAIQKGSDSRHTNLQDSGSGNINARFTYNIHWLGVELDSTYAILLSRQMYAGELHGMDFTEYLNWGGIANSAALKSTAKQGLGALIWLRKPRPAIGFAVAEMATQNSEACGSPEKARK